MELRRDTERLLQLTNELKQYVDHTNENILSLEVIKKAEEIERLAKSVRVKMKGKDWVVLMQDVLSRAWVLRDRGNQTRP